MQRKRELRTTAKRSRPKAFLTVTCGNALVLTHISEWQPELLRNRMHCPDGTSDSSPAIYRRDGSHTAGEESRRGCDFFDSVRRATQSVVLTSVDTTPDLVWNEFHTTKDHSLGGTAERAKPIDTSVVPPGLKTRCDWTIRPQQ